MEKLVLKLMDILYPEPWTVRSAYRVSQNNVYCNGGVGVFYCFAEDNTIHYSDDVVTLLDYIPEPQVVEDVLRIWFWDNFEIKVNGFIFAGYEQVKKN